MARQFNLIPPVCEQAEYHFFQRDKVETQLPELYHKIGKSSQTFPAPVNVGYFLSMLCCILLGVGVVSWSPLACGIITGKYENGVPESSRASMKVQGLLVLSGSLFFFNFYYKTVLNDERNHHCNTVLSSPLSAISVVKGENNERGWKETAGQAQGTGSHSRKAGVHFTTISYR